jgi:hypothetical protein
MSKINEGITPTLDNDTQDDNNKGEVYALEDIARADNDNDNEHDDDIMAQKRKALDEGEPVQLKSEFDTLGTLKAISVFRKTAFICAIAGFAASTDGTFSPLPHVNLTDLNRIPESDRRQRRRQPRFHKPIRRDARWSLEAGPNPCFCLRRYF